MHVIYVYYLLTYAKFWKGQSSLRHIHNHGCLGTWTQEKDRKERLLRVIKTAEGRGVHYPNGNSGFMDIKTLKLTKS